MQKQRISSLTTDICHPTPTIRRLHPTQMLKPDNYPDKYPLNFLVFQNYSALAPNTPKTEHISNPL